MQRSSRWRNPALTSRSRLRRPGTYLFVPRSPSRLSLFLFFFQVVSGNRIAWRWNVHLTYPLKSGTLWAACLVWQSTTTGIEESELFPSRKTTAGRRFRFPINLVVPCRASTSEPPCCPFGWSYRRRPVCARNPTIPALMGHVCEELLLASWRRYHECHNSRHHDHHDQMLYNLRGEEEHQELGKLWLDWGEGREVVCGPRSAR
jgi:hypothetical protein